MPGCFLHVLVPRRFASFPRPGFGFWGQRGAFLHQSTILRPALHLRHLLLTLLLNRGSLLHLLPFVGLGFEAGEHVHGFIGGGFGRAGGEDSGFDAEVGVGGSPLQRLSLQPTANLLHLLLLLLYLILILGIDLLRNHQRRLPIVNEIALHLILILQPFCVLPQLVHGLGRVQEPRLHF